VAYDVVVVKVVIESMRQDDICGHYREAKELFDAILCRVEPLLELLEFVEVEQGVSDESLYSDVVKFDVQVRKARDSPVWDRPSPLDYISFVQSLGEYSDI